MKTIIVNTKSQLIGNILVSFLKNYFENNVILLDILTIKDFSIDTLAIIVDSNYVDIDNIKELISKNYNKVILLTSLENKKLIEDMTNNFLIFPLFFPHLLNKLNQIKLISINKNSILRKFDFIFQFDYNKAMLTSSKLNTSVTFTLTEGNLFQRLFIESPNEVNLKDLYNVSNCFSFDKNTLETHIANIKKKLINTQLNISITKDKDKYKMLIY